MESPLEILEKIESTFPFVDKPKGLDLSFHKVGCIKCEIIRRHLAEYTQPHLPFEALRYLHSEMDCLSAKGWCWVLPSLLRHCVTAEATFDDVETGASGFVVGRP